MPRSSSRRALLSCFAAALLASSLGAGPAVAAEAAKKEYEFLALGDFTVNLPAAGRRMSYVVVSVTLETRSAETQGFRDVSPRLRQAVLRKLMAMSERNQLRPGQTDPALLRDSLYDSLAQVREDGLRDVVITRLLHS
ncbi:flagellar basal body-associated FliL family protein [Roseomonas marmotae]|uniref:Flagellar protein FliL n=1 Tax=Roseomonas marmotae TaxID=2768161 RepID=A0ABS3KF80_9PROT|nr:flagellar basal body-associated FliL family protein [Roseomonas marmotae]MBO1076126.1 flagellar basal body-associated FliL family protein [Roseomonas marmotae]QTI81260.1 flagellar basal body-associated FliL family protein [Roseomonas marmotae]